jgi:hypothetical protein
VTTDATSTPDAIKKEIGIWLDTGHIVLTVLLIAVLLIGVYIFDAKRAELADARTAKAEAVSVQARADATLSAKQNIDFQAQTVAQLDALAQARASLLQANLVISQAQTQRKADLAVQQAAVAKAAPSDVAKDWEGLIPTAAVTAVPGGFTIDAAGGLATVQELLQVPVLNSTITDLGQVINSDNKVITNYATALSDEKASHVSDVKNDAIQLTSAKDDLKTAKDQRDKAVADGRKGKLKWFGIGFVTGYIAAITTAVLK